MIRPSPFGTRLVAIVRAVTIIAILQTANAMGAAGRSRFTRFGPEEGLRHPVVRAVLQTGDGFLWFGTNDGLLRYDGYDFKRIGQKPSEGPRVVIPPLRALLQDGAGVMWLGTHDLGLIRYDPRSGSVVEYRHDPEDPRALPNDSIHALCQTPDGELWIATDNGLARLDRERGSFEVFKHERSDPGSLSSDYVTSVAVAAGNDVWVGTDGGLNRFDRDERRFVHYQHDEADPSTLSGDHINAILEDRHGLLWVGTYQNGLNRLDPRTGAVVRYEPDPENPDAFGSKAAKTIYEDSSGRIWIGTWGDGLERFDEARKAFVHYAHNPSDPDSLSDNRVYAIEEDAVGQIWVGTHVGANRYDPLHDVFTRYQHERDNPNSLPSSQVIAVHEDGRGEVWVGTYGEGMARIDPRSGRVTRYRHEPDDPESLANEGVWSIAEDSEGRLWIGTSRGLHRYVPERDGFVRYQKDPHDPHPFSGSNILSIHEDRQGFLWLGTWDGGINRFDPDSGDVLHYLPAPDDPEALAGSSIYSILEDSKGSLWIGTTGFGLHRLDPERRRFRRYRYRPDDPESLSSQTVRTSFEDSKGRLWIGTETGLDLWRPDTDTFARHQDGSGPQGFPVYGIVEDARGHLWVSTSQGIARFDPETTSFKWYDASDGLQGAQYTTGAHARGRDGRIYFGGPNGLDVFDPEAVTDHTYRAPVVLTDFLLLNQSVSEGPDSPLERDITSTKAITLDYRDYPFTFEFSTLNFRQPEKNRFAYKLEGVDRDWIYTDARNRRASYTMVPHGTRRFRVKAANDDGYWNEEGTSIEITVLPPWWDTRGFKTLAGLTAAAFLFGGIRWRVHAVERQNRRLMSLVAERTRELEASNRKLEEASLTDPLTGMRNRRFLHEHIEHHVSRVLRVNRAAELKGERPTEADIVFVLIDLDHFKRVNDDYGHDAGDRVLIGMRELLSSVCRESDLLIRWGGEELLVVCLSISRKDAFATAERIRGVVRRHAFAVGGARTVRLTCSVGCASFPFLPETPEALSWEQVVTLADRALYLSKTSGRDQTHYVSATELTAANRILKGSRRDFDKLVEADEVAVRSSLAESVQA